MTVERSSAGTQAGRAYEQLRRDIVRCELVPGERVSEQLIAARYGFGRAATRAALARLDQEGLVHAVPRQGTVVAPITMRDVQELFHTRQLIEPAAMAEAASRITQVDDRERAELAVLEDACRQARFRPGDRDGAERFLAANTRFHVAVVAITGNGRLTRLVEGLLVDLERMFQLGLMLRDRSDEMYHEHHELLDALLASDAPRTTRVARAQIESARVMVTDGLLASPQLLATNVAPTGEVVP